jgi:hypothetical protein
MRNVGEEGMAKGYKQKQIWKKKKGICRHLSDNKFGSYPKLPRHLYIKLKNSGQG